MLDLLMIERRLRLKLCLFYSQNWVNHSKHILIIYKSKELTYSDGTSQSLHMDSQFLDTDSLAEYNNFPERVN